MNILMEISVPIPTQAVFFPSLTSTVKGTAFPITWTDTYLYFMITPSKMINAGFMQIVTPPPSISNKNKESCLWTDQKGAEDVEGDEVDEGKLCSAAVAIGVGAVVAVWQWVTPDVHGVSTRQHDLLPRFTRCRPAPITHTQEVQHNKHIFSLFFSAHPPTAAPVSIALDKQVTVCRIMNYSHWETGV